MKNIKIKDIKTTECIDDFYTLWNITLGKKYPLSRNTFRFMFPARLNNRKGGIIAAFNKNKIVGYLLYEILPISWGRPWTAISTIIVEPNLQRKGIGTELLKYYESKIKRLGISETCVGGFAYRIWPGIPEDLKIAQMFFRKYSYNLEETVCDLVIQLKDYKIKNIYKKAIEKAEVRITNAQWDDLIPVITFLKKEYPWYIGYIFKMISAEDMENILIMKKNNKICGIIQTYNPKSNYSYANLHWSKVFKGNLGSCAGVAIARKYQKKGLGAALFQTVVEYVQKQGVKYCYIDWTDLPEFYIK